MYALATCRGDILRGVTEDDYGDETDTDTVHQADVLASLQETSSAVFDSTSQTLRVARGTTAWFPSGTDIKTSDRFRDTTHDVLYWVENVTNVSGAGTRSDLKVDLRRVT